MLQHLQHIVLHNITHIFLQKLVLIQTVRRPLKFEVSLSCLGSELRTGLNIELNHPPNLERLVIDVIEANLCNQILILLHFSRSTRFAFLCTAQISKFQQKTRHDFGKNEFIESNFRNIDIKIAIFLQIFDEIIYTTIV